MNSKTVPKSDYSYFINFSSTEVIYLNNGVIVLCEENHTFPIVDISITFDHDPICKRNKTGIKDLLGKLLCAGTKNYTNNQLKEKIDYMGTSFGNSYSVIYLSSLKRYIDSSLDIFSEIIIYPRLDNTVEFETFIKQSITELEIYQENFQEIMYRVASILYYGKNHPFGEFPTIYTLKNINISDILYFYINNFVPQKAYLTFIGDLKKEESKKIAKKYFNLLEKRFFPPQKKNKVSIPLETEIDLVDVPTSTQVILSLGGVINFRKSSIDYFPAIVSNEILGGGTQSRLFLNIREDKGYSYIGNSILIDNKIISFFQAITQVRTSVAIPAIKEFIKEIKNIEQIPTLNEVELIKKYLAGNFILSLEDLQTLSKFEINEIIETLPKKKYKNYLKKLSKITPLDVLMGAKKYLNFKIFRLLIVGDVRKIIFSLKDLVFPIYIFDNFGSPICYDE